ncbi:hypothetical protein TRVA0_054S00298 [Trichomonascus vanleenenianus]|uniref:uncharacterized protein n=1 Tax=Trichomonascus vanleenenianus TaxID=2268995 RepID=UPI003ECA0659
MAVFYLGCSSRDIRDSVNGVVEEELIGGCEDDDDEEERSGFQDIYDSVDPDDDVPIPFFARMGRRAQSCVEYSSSYRSNLTMRLQRIEGNVNVVDETRSRQHHKSWSGSSFKGFDSGATLFERRTGLKHNFSLNDGTFEKQPSAVFSPALEPPSPLSLEDQSTRLARTTTGAADEPHGEPHAADENAAPSAVDDDEQVSPCSEITVDPVSLIDSCSSLSTSTTATSPLSLSDDSPFSWPKEPISGLVSDKYIHDKFHQRPLLADTEKPFIPCEPVFESVDEMLRKCYPGLSPEQHAYHRQRLISNRHKLLELRQHVESQYAQRRRNSATAIATSQYEKAQAAFATEKRRMRVKLH